MNGFIIAALIGLIGGYFWQQKQKSKLVTSKGSLREPTKTSPILKDISAVLLETLELPSKEFRAALGIHDPELAMAFRQSLNFGVTRYCDLHYASDPNESLKNDLINRLLCTYFGIILPQSFELADAAKAINLFSKQRKLLLKAEVVQTSGNEPTLTVFEKENPLTPIQFSKTKPEDRLMELGTQLEKLFETENYKAQLFRQNDKEVGILVCDAETFSKLTPYQMLLATA